MVYTDNEGDMLLCFALLVGDDPWNEFCSMVRNIRILSPSEVEKLTLTPKEGKALMMLRKIQNLISKILHPLAN